MVKQEDEIRIFIETIPKHLADGDISLVISKLEIMHPADTAEIIRSISDENAIAIVRLLNEEIRSDVVAELDPEEREKLLEELPAVEIAESVVTKMDSDDAADLLSELSPEKQSKVINALEDSEQAQDLLDLLAYDEDSAGGLMAKELVKVRENWSVKECEFELRKQAEEVDDVHTVYVVNDEDKLVGIISLKALILNSPETKVKTISKTDIISIKASEKSGEVSRIMDKYDLVVLPVVDENNYLVGRITIDDVVDVIVEEAEKDYQMLSGISEDVESSDNIWQLTRARFPWLLVGMLGGILGAKVIGIFEKDASPALMLYIPLIAAMGGNVGIQSSAIVVQGIANQTLSGSIISKLMKELGVGIVNGLLCGFILFFVNIYWMDFDFSFAISISLVSVIIFAALFGTWIPLFFNKIKIDPALATGPFITTANDIFGLFLYFYICKILVE
ncbi:MAG: magnesium transporter [Flavobacteriales bacterium]|nr:magnesium transporter [Flavobacteriales bacterium]MBO72940.1 magnesium transporter [Flavobacteriales bacterium]|tara:strand:- start:4942 stop:6288 length:1347 start_codon:yes stop_codon:yes gene_type:complete